MTKIYAQFGIVIYDSTLVEKVQQLFSKLGNYIQKITKNGNTIFDYNTPEFEVFELEPVSDFLCDVLEKDDNLISEFATFYSNNIEKCFMNIYFVFVTENDASIILNKRIISLANRLNIDISFDGI